MKKKKAFTIVELLTVMSIIIILFSLLVPAMNRIRRYAKTVKQHAQFHSISAGIELYRNEFEGLPPSDELDHSTVAGGVDYCGAMKLAEAMLGQDLLGFHPASPFRADGFNASGTDLYPEDLDPDIDEDKANLRDRKGPYLELDGANAYRMADLWSDFSPFDSDVTEEPNGPLVLCDEYPRTRSQLTGKRIGMPILFYRADTTRLKHNYVDREESIYNSDDNQELVDLPLPWDLTYYHPMASTGTTPDGESADPTIFYSDDMTRDKNITTIARPYRADSYILISAGFDSLYGTRDDIFNFQK